MHLTIQDGMDIFGPRVCNARTVYSIFAQVFDEQGNLRSNYYRIDLTEVVDSDIAGAVGVATLIQWLRRQSIAVDIAFPLTADNAFGYLRDLNPGNDAGENASDRCDSPLPFHILEPEGAVDWIAGQLVVWMAHELYVTPTIAASRTRYLKELFDNAASHSYCHSMIAAAYCDRDEQRVSCVIADDGIGIPQAVRRVWKESINDTVAITRAIEPGFTSGAYEGKGLNRFIEQLTVRNRGSIAIHSGFGLVRCRHNNGQKVTRLEGADAFFPGTMFVVQFEGASLGSIPLMNEPEPDPHFYKESM